MVRGPENAPPSQKIWKTDFFLTSHCEFSSFKKFFLLVEKYSENYPLDFQEKPIWSSVLFFWKFIFPNFPCPVNKPLYEKHGQPMSQNLFWKVTDIT